MLWGVVLAAAAAGLYLFASVWLYAEPAAYKDSAQYVEDIAGGFSASLGYAAEGDKPDGSFPFLYCVTLEDGSVHANTLANAASVYDEELGYTVAVDLDGNVLLNLSPEAQSEALTIINGQDAQNAAAQGASESTDNAANAPNAASPPGVAELPSGIAYLWDGASVQAVATGPDHGFLLPQDVPAGALADAFADAAAGSGLAVRDARLFLSSARHVDFSQTYYNRHFQAVWDGCIVPALALLGAVLAAALWLLVTAGRTGAGALRVYWIDRWPTEFHALAIVCMALGAWALCFWYARYANDPDAGFLPDQALFMAYALGALVLALALSVSRKLKNHLFWRASLTGWLLQKLGFWASGDAVLARTPFAQRGAKRVLWVGGMAVLGVLASLLLLAFFGFDLTVAGLLTLLFFWGAGGMWYLYVLARRDARALAALLDAIEQAGRGQPSRALLADGHPLQPYAQAVAQLEDTAAKNAEARIKSERMKIDLITNVSHDLKTPLTSIIGYVDLLQKQELPAEAADYARILQAKAERLSDTVSDLFTLAKSTSGAEPIALAPLDLVMAVRQTLADMSDAVEKSGIPVRTALPECAWVHAESAKLYRVLQNLLDNALRYSLAGTRIYLSVERTAHATVRLCLSNTASYEMDFTAEEIMQRFARGDRARTTQGSGLGLSIAESFMQNFGGDLSVTIDGDVFRTACTFRAAPAPEGADKAHETDTASAHETGAEKGAQP